MTKQEKNTQQPQTLADIKALLPDGVTRVAIHYKPNFVTACCKINGWS